MPGPITYEVMRDDTIACIEALGIAGAHLVGWSDGGIVALLVAIERPDLRRFPGQVILAPQERRQNLLGSVP